jgi:hypothetical protein
VDINNASAMTQTQVIKATEAPKQNIKAASISTKKNAAQGGVLFKFSVQSA